jgi:predicted DCC family thiol-disulfide oxidoreductase YuxK
MRNGWTGGQYSIYRAFFGLYLLVHFAMLIPWAGEIFDTILPREASPLLLLFPNILAVADAATPLVVVATIASLFFIAGLGDRIAAVVMWYALACLFGRNPLIANPSLPFVGWLLLAHALLPPAPWGSLAAKGRTDPRGGWSMPPAIFAAAWIVMSLGYTFSGYTKLISPSWVDGTAFARVLANPLARPSFVRDVMLGAPPALLTVATYGALALELLYAPLALFRRARPWIWLAMLLMHFGLMVLIDFADLSFGMVILHFFTFDPAWIRQTRAAAADLVFYDGTCGLCHGGMRWLAAEDPTGSTFVFAPIGGERFMLEIPAGSSLPDSVIVKTAEGDLLVRSAAALRMLHRLGGLWRVFAFALQPLPKRLLDRGYDFIASIRYRIFGRTKDACPLVPADLRSRFSA